MSMIFRCRRTLRSAQRIADDRNGRDGTSLNNIDEGGVESWLSPPERVDLVQLSSCRQERCALRSRRQINLVLNIRLARPIPPRLGTLRRTRCRSKLQGLRASHPRAKLFATL